MKKEYLSEDKERYRPLLNLKRDLPDFFEDIEKEEKRIEITIKRELQSLVQIIQKQSQEVLQTRKLIQQSMTDPSLLDKIH